LAKGLLKELRIEQTRDWLGLLRDDIGKWLTRRRAADRLHQYQTQLNSLDAALSGALDAVQKDLATLAEGEDIGTVYAACRQHDQRLALVRRLWTYYRDKFDQRDDKTYGEVLAAADEVVWSCYAEPFANVGPYMIETAPPTRGPAPLPYIESRLAPEALPRDRPPGDLQSDKTDALVYRFVEKLPIPIVALPATCVQTPWWLAYLAHETGHHLQFDLAPGLELVTRFGDAIADAVNGVQATDANDVARWRRCGEEIFADVCSVYSIGPSAVRAMVELERSDETAMLGLSRPTYPVPAVRLALLGCVAQRLGFAASAALGDFDPKALVVGPPVVTKAGDVRRSAKRDMDIMPAVVDAAMRCKVVSQAGLAELYGWHASDFESNGTVDEWAKQLLGPGNIAPETRIRAARMQISAAVQAWITVTTLETAQQRHDAQARLAEKLLPLLAESREPATRAADASIEPDFDALKQQMGDLLLSIAPDSEGINA